MYRKKKVARALPGTLVFFDKFCPDLHGAAAAVGLDGSTASSEGEGDVGRPSPSPSPSGSPPSKHLLPSSSMLAACRWCSAELGNASVFVLSDDGDGQAGDEEDSEHCCSTVQGCPCSDDAQARTGAEEEGGTATRVVLGLRDFLGDFVGGEAGEELARRGDLLRGVHLSNKVNSR